MIRFCASLLLPVLISVYSLGAKSHLMRFADISAKYIVFTYENDLWLVALDDNQVRGPAKRITRGAGTEIYAKFSPDGTMLAFTANYDGGNDVYVMEVHGSSPQRLTYHPASDLVIDWYPDGKHVLFRSRRTYPYHAHQLYKVPIYGGVPEKINVDRAGLATLSPDARQLAYNRISREFRNWKRYKGGLAQDIWLGEINKGNYQPITTFDGTDNFPMWHQNYIYFNSDRKNGTLNLFNYELDSGTIKQLTNYDDYDVKYPSLGPDHIIFQYGESLHLLDLQNNNTISLDIEIPTDRTKVRDTYINASQYPGGFALSPEGNRAIFDIRGEIINLPTDEGVIYNLTNSSESREKNPVWSPDGQKVAFFSDKTGEEELYITDPYDGSDLQQLTKGNQGFLMNPVWSPDSKYILYHDKYMRLNMVAIESGKHTIIDQSNYDDAWERWGIQDYCWSPDSKWIAYAKMERSLYESIFLYSLEKNKRYRITDDLTRDWSPSFSKNGKYLYFLSNRHLEPVMGFIDQNFIFLNTAQPYLFILNQEDPSPFAPENQTGEKTETEKDRSKNIVVNLEDIDRRILPVPLPAGNLFRLTAIETGFLFLRKENNEFLKYQTVTDDYQKANLDLYKFDLESKEEQLLINGISQYHLSPDGKKLIYKAGPSFGVVDAGASANVGDGYLSLTNVDIRIDLLSEFQQIFSEAWRVQRDWFYAPDMHGVDWQKVKDKYIQFVPYCGTRSDLNYLIGEMIAELNAGHTYVYGGDLERTERISVAYLGADFETPSPQEYPRLKHILPYNSLHAGICSPLLAPVCPIQVGDYILAVDGEAIKTGDNIFKYMQQKTGKIIEITYNSKPSLKGAEKHVFKPLSSEYKLRYYQWVDENRQYVHNRSEKIGYLHLPNMMEDGLIEFSKIFYPHYYKEAFIIDARYNGGGFTSKMIIDRLERKLLQLTQPREGKTIRTPERVFYGHLVLLINRDTGSDGEIFANSWKQHNLGEVIGERTWGGAVGIEPHQELIDQGVTTPPQFGEYTWPSHWIIEGHGVEPTIKVQNRPEEVLKGKDPQLEKAVEHLLKKLREDPKELPKQPDYPDKSKATLK